MLKDISGAGDVNPEDIIEWMESNKVNQLTNNDIVELVIQGEVTKRKRLRGWPEKSHPTSRRVQDD